MQRENWEFETHTLVDLAGEEAFEASNDLTRGPAVRRAASHVFDGRLVEPHADEHGSIEGGVGLSVTAPIEPMPAGGPPGRGRDRTGAAQLRERGFGANPVGVIAEEDQHLGRGAGADPEALTKRGRRLGREAHEGRCCTNRPWPARCPPPGSSPADAIRHWSTEGGHPIQDLTAEDGLTPLPGWAPGAKAIADDGLVAEERVLHPALTMVP